MKHSLPSPLSLFIVCYFLILMPPLILQAQEDHVWTLDDAIVVTANRLPTAFPQVARNVSVLTEQQIAELPAEGFDDILNYIAGVDVQERGAAGVQSDINIRGASFEQTLVLINGIKLIDPQTGHHTMNLPLTKNDIARIEILKGQGARLYGPNAFGGVINIITKNPQMQNFEFNAEAGMHGLFGGTLSAGLPTKFGNHQISLAVKKSDGYRRNTEFDIRSAHYGYHSNFAGLNVHVSSGVTDKKFGANSFYHPSFPLQWEHTQALFNMIKLSATSGNRSYAFNASWRYHHDDFLLDRARPAFYHNQHFSNVYGLEGQFNQVSRFGVTSISGEVLRMQIASNNLGDHTRDNYGISVDHQISYKKLNLTLGTALYHHTNWGWHFWPGADIGFSISDKLTWFNSIGHAFRIPTYTELYYKDAANQGNAKLRAESAWNYETGVRFIESNVSVTTSIFLRDGKNLIDWTWVPDDSVWYARNITRLKTTGFEFDAQYKLISEFFGIKNLQFNYTFLNTDKSTNRQVSKYIINHLKHQLTAGFTQRIIFDHLKYTLLFRFEDRLQYGQRYLLDGRLVWQIKDIDWYLDATNILNHQYEDYFAIPLPGRWIKTGIRLRLTGSDND